MATKPLSRASRHLSQGHSVSLGLDTLAIASAPMPPGRLGGWISWSGRRGWKYKLFEYLQYVWTIMIACLSMFKVSVGWWNIINDQELSICSQKLERNRVLQHFPGPETWTEFTLRSQQSHRSHLPISGNKNRKRMQPKPVPTSIVYNRPWFLGVYFNNVCTIGNPRGNHSQ